MAAQTHQCFRQFTGSADPRQSSASTTGSWKSGRCSVATDGSSHAPETTLRAIDEHTEFVRMPPTFLFVFMLLLVLGFGVVWELLEFYISVGANLVGAATVLTQYGLEETVLDLFYNTLGGLLVAIFGAIHLAGVSTDLAERFDARSANR